MKNLAILRRKMGTHRISIAQYWYKQVKHINCSVILWGTRNRIFWEALCLGISRSHFMWTTFPIYCQLETQPSASLLKHFNFVTSTTKTHTTFAHFPLYLLFVLIILSLENIDFSVNSLSSILVITLSEMFMHSLMKCDRHFKNQVLMSLFLL